MAWDSSSLIRDRTHAPCIGRLLQCLNHWTTREVPGTFILLLIFTIIKTVIDTTICKYLCTSLIIFSAKVLGRTLGQKLLLFKVYDT